MRAPASASAGTNTDATAGAKDHVGDVRCAGGRIDARFDSVELDRESRSEQLEEVVRAAREAGVKLVIDSDGHQVAALDYVELGVGQARRAWLTKDDVLNTRTWAQIEKLRKKRP